MSSRPLLILDIDETLIHAKEEPLSRVCDLSVGEFHVYYRPNLLEFLGKVTCKFDLAYWSSASAPYVDSITKAITPEGCSTAFVWSRNRCKRRVDFELQEEYFLKDLKKVKRKGYDLNRVLIIEDEPRKVGRNFGNAGYVRAWLGEEADDELPKLAHYLLSICDHENFRVLEKRDWRRSVK